MVLDAPLIIQTTRSVEHSTEDEELSEEELSLPDSTVAMMVEASGTSNPRRALLGKDTIAAYTGGSVSGCDPPRLTARRGFHPLAILR